MSSINFGGLGSNNNILGNNAIGGFASGINTSVLIQAALAPTQKPIINLQTEKSENTAKIAALKQLKGVFLTLQDLSKTLKKTPGIGSEDQNAFLYRKATVTGSTVGVDSASDLLAVVADPGAANATYTFEIEQIATKEIEVIEGFTTVSGDLTDGGTPEVVAGTFQINGVDIEVFSGDSLADIKAAINAQSSDTGVTANIITVTPESEEGAGDGVYQLQLVSNNTGSDNTIDFTGFTDIFPPSGGVTVTETQGADDAIIKFNGNTITRSTNTINDIVDNVTFSLLEAEDDTILTINITNDTSVPQTQITNFVAGVNNALIFFSKQQAKDPVTGEPLPGAILSNSSLIRTLSGLFKQELTRTVTGISGQYSNLSNVGFSLELFSGPQIDGSDDTPDTALLTDDGSLNTALINNFDDVKELFEFSFNAVGANNKLAYSSATNALTTDSFIATIDVNQSEGQRVQIEVDGETYYATFDPYDDNDLTAGGTIIGAADTPIEGLRMVYTGDGTDGPITVNVSQGVGFRFNNILEGYIDFQGTIDQQIQNLQERNVDIDDEIADINVKVEKLKQNLIARYAVLERIISQANSTLGFIQASTNAIFKN